MAEAIGNVNIKFHSNTATLKWGLRSNANDMRQWSRTAKGIFESTRTSAENYRQQQETLGATWKKGMIDAGTYTRAMRQLKQQYKDLNTVTAEIVPKQRSAMSGMIGFAKSFVGVGIAVTTAYRALNLYKQAISSGFNRIEGLNKSMNRSLAIQGDVDPGTRGKMRGLAIDISKETIFEANELAEAYFFLASAGLKTEQQMASLPVVAKFAQAGMFDLATATSLLTDAQSALGLKSKDARVNMRNMTDLADKLVKANTLADASTHEFAEALAGPLAGALRANKRPLEEGIALLALLAERGQKGAEASGTGSVLFRDLPRAVAKNADAFRKYDIELINSAGNMKAMSEMVTELTNGLMPMSDIARAAAMENMGLTRSVRDIILKLMEGGEELHSFQEILKDTGGTMADVAGKQMTDLESASARLSGSWTALWEDGSDMVKVYAASLDIVAAKLDKLGNSNWAGKLTEGANTAADAMSLLNLSSGQLAGGAFGRWLGTPDKSGAGGAAGALGGVNIRQADREAAAFIPPNTEMFSAIADAFRRGPDLLSGMFPKEKKDNALTKWIGGIQEQIDDATAKAAKETKRNADAMKREGEALSKSLRDPFEVFRDEVTRFRELVKSGDLSEDEFGAAAEIAKKTALDELTKDISKADIGTISGIGVDSAGATALLAQMQARRVSQELTPETKELKKHTITLDRILTELKDGKVATPP